MKKELAQVTYLASPYSYYSDIPILGSIISAVIRYLRYKKITKVAAILTENFPVALILPITQSHQLQHYMSEVDTGFSKWESIDLGFIAASKEVWVVTMSGWKESVGVQAEIKFARKHKIPVRYVHPDTLKITRRPSRS